MEYIKSKDIFLLVRDTLKMISPRIMKHGSRVAYVVYIMLREEGKYEEFELADMVMTATLHDIGAYKTEKERINDMLRYEYRDYMAHSIYGYLFFKYLSPVPELARVIMYHHTDYEKLQGINYEYKDVAAYINIAEKIDHYCNALGNKFEPSMLQKYAGTRISEEGLNLFFRCEEKYGIFEKIRSGEYLKELDAIIEYMIFNNEDKKKFLEMLMYCQGFFRSGMVIETAMAVCVSEEIAREMMLPEHKREILYYGTLVHDIGMLAIPIKLIETPRKLDPREARVVRKHVEFAGEILSTRMKKEVVDIALAHHERCDGSGYPNRLTDPQMSTEQKILQVTDVVVALLNRRSYRKPLPKEKVIAILDEKAGSGRLKRQVEVVVVKSYDRIVERARSQSAQIVEMYEKLNNQYEMISEKYNI